MSLTEAHDKINSLEKKKYKLKNLNKELNNKISEMKEEIKDLNKNFSLKEENYREKLELYKDFKIKALDFKNGMDQMIYKVSLVKNELKKLKKDKNNLIEERDRLFLRSSANFEDLTPRPNFKKLFLNKNLNFNEIIKSNLKD